MIIRMTAPEAQAAEAQRLALFNLTAAELDAKAGGKAPDR